MSRSFFRLAEANTTVRTEMLAGLTTFLTMAYITFVNPAILSKAGVDFGAAFVATCIAAALGSGIMGLYANYPIALAPGMGLNAFFTYSVVLGTGHSWQVALGTVFISGVLFVGLSLLPVREWIINSIPPTLKLAIAAGIGFFLALIALQNANIVVDNPATLVTLGDLKTPESYLALFGFVVIIALDARRLAGAVIIGILAITALGIALGVTEWKGVMAMPPDPSPTLLQLDVRGALEPSLITVVLTFLLVDLFDTAGTLIGLTHHSNLLNAQGQLPRLKNALMADSVATVAGAVLGTSTTTSYIESAAGMRAGGRTGLTAIVVAVLFLLALFFSPLAQTVPSYATAPALLFVACVMMRSLAEFDWDDATEYVPAVVTTLAMPLTYSISDGIGLGFITFAATKLASGKPGACPPAVWIIAVLFAGKFIFL